MTAAAGADAGCGDAVGATPATGIAAPVPGPRTALLVDLRLGDFREVLHNFDAGFVLTDPPYGNFFRHDNVGRGYASGQTIYYHAANHAVAGDDLSFLDDFFDLCKTTPTCIFADHTGFSRYEAAAKRHGLRIVGTAVWDKQSIGLGYNFRPQHELLLFSKKPVRAIIKNLPSVLRCPRPQKKLHPTQKPVALLRCIVEAFVEPGDTVCDPFTGSGSTAVACVESSRSFVGSEIDPVWFEVAKTRIAAA